MDHTNTSPIAYLALGDSYTIGTSVTAAESWPALLADALAKTGTDGKSYTT
ncbi:MAG: lysophospholipase L1-like esterase, partial [Neolewinella sp.]